MLKKIVLLLTLLIELSSFSQSLYDIDNITEIDITFSDPNWDATMDTYYSNDLDELLMASVLINGVSFDSVGVTYKGNSTYNATNAKNPIKLVLDAVYDQDFQGYQTLKLSNGQKDPSFVREVEFNWVSKLVVR